MIFSFRREYRCIISIRYHQFRLIKKIHPCPIRNIKFDNNRSIESNRQEQEREREREKAIGVSRGARLPFRDEPGVEEC